MAQASFHGDDTARLASMADPPLAFMLGWTRKEACLKAMGLGLSSLADMRRHRAGLAPSQFVFSQRAVEAGDSRRFLPERAFVPDGGRTGRVGRARIAPAFAHRLQRQRVPTHDPHALRPALAPAVRPLPRARAPARHRGARLRALRPGSDARAPPLPRAGRPAGALRAWRCCASTTTAPAIRPGTNRRRPRRLGARRLRRPTQELLRRSRARRRVVLARRAPGRAAWPCMAARRPAVRSERLVLWDPVVRRPPLPRQRCGARHVDALEAPTAFPTGAWRRSLARDPTAFTDELLGFGISPLLRDQMRALTPEPRSCSPRQRMTVSGRRGRQPGRTLGATRARPRTSRLTAWSRSQHPLIWTSDPLPNNAMVPAEALQRMLARING